LDIVTVSQTTKLFLACCIPNTEFNGSIFGVENERVNFNAERGYIFLFKFTSLVTLNKCGFSSTTVTNENNL